MKEKNSWLTYHEYDRDGNRQIRFVFSDESHVIYQFKTGKAIRFNANKMFVGTDDVENDIDKLTEVLVGIEKSIK